MRLKVIILAEGTMGLHLLQALLERDLHHHDIQIQAVFRWSVTQTGKNFKTPADRQIAKLAKLHRIPDLDLPSANHPQFYEVLARFSPHIIFIASWGEILKAPLLDWPGLLILNIHPSLLPRYRGANPYMAVIQQGEPETGITLHQVTAGVDRGPILAQTRVLITDTDTGGTLQTRCAQAMQALFLQVLPQLVNACPHWQTLPWQPQNEALASTCKALTLSDGAIQWDDPPVHIQNRVRAIQPWMPAYTFCHSGLGPLLLAFREVGISSPAPPERQGRYPGEILKLTLNHGIQVQSCERETVLTLKQVRLYAWTGYLPVWLSALVLKALLRCGTRLLPPGRADS